MSDKLYLHNSKLLSLLRTLDKKERKQFDLWLSSPFHNTSEEICHLYHGLISQKNLNQPVLKSNLIKYLDESFVLSKQDEISPSDDLSLRKAMSKLTAQLQDFLIYQKSKEDPFSEKRQLMDILIERKLYKLLPAVLTKSKKELEASSKRSIGYYENIFQVTEMEFYQNIILNNRNTKVDLQQVIDKLWQAHICKVLRYYCAAKNGEKILKISCEYPLIDALKTYLENSPNKDIPVIRVYYALLHLIEKEEPKYFYELKTYLFDNLEIFDLVEIRQFFNHLTNYCTRAIRIGRSEFIQERQDVYEAGLKLKCWSEGTYFSKHQFIHIARNALWLGKIDWADGFVDEYAAVLHPDAKVDTLHYYRALAAFERKAYEQAQDELIQITNTEDFAYHIEFKILLIKIYYDLEPLNEDNADSHPINYELESIRHYTLSTRNKKISESLRQSYNNFVNLLKRILNRKKKLLYGETLKSSSLEKLKEELNTEIPLVQRDWLKGKVVELGEEVV